MQTDISRLHSSEYKCIKEIVELPIGQTETWYSWNDFKRSFIDERWDGERRYDTRMTLWGYAHRKMTIRNPFSGEMTRRFFHFPNSMESAKQLHIENTSK